MTQRPAAWALGVGAAMGALAFILLYQQASEIQRKSTPIPVLVAKRYIPAGVPLRPDWVELRQVPEAYVSPSALSDLRPLEGLVSLAPLSSGEQVLSNKFGKPGEGLAWTLDPGFRAFTLAVDETGGVGGLLNPGDRVDLLYKGAAGGKEATSFLYQNLRVLAVGGRVGSGDASGVPAGYSHVTLSVSPAQAEELFFLEGRSQVRLVLRCRGDEAEVRLPASDEGTLYRRLKNGAAPSEAD